MNSTTYKNDVDSILKNIPKKNCVVLITGATGLIGSCIIDILLARNHQGADYKIVAVSRKYVNLVNRFGKETKNLKYLEQDLSNPFVLNSDFDYIIHAASDSDPAKYALKPVEVMEGNLLGLDILLRYCAKHKKTKIFYASTFEVYGITNKKTKEEDDFGLINFNMIRSAYPESKRVGELLLRSYVSEYKINGVIGRFPSVFGPTMISSDTKAHAQFFRNAINHKNIILKSKANQKRNYLYVIDAAYACLTILFKGKNGEAYNISNTKSVITIREFAKIVSNISKSKIITEAATLIELKGYGIKQNSILENNKLYSIGWSSQFSLKTSIQNTFYALNELRKYLN